MGRPSLYSDDILDRIVERLSVGEPLAAICRDEGMPGLRTVYDWAERDDSVSARIARAREAGEEAIASDCLLIADNSPLTELSSQVSALIDELGDEAEENVARKIEALENLERRFNDLVQERKLRIDTRLKLLAKWNPRKWGERLQHANDPTDPMPAPQFIVMPTPAKGSE